MKVLVTGGTGFAGRHLVEILEARGHECAFTFTSGGDAGPRSFRLALPDENRCLDVVRESRPDAVVHLAGISFVPDAEKSPLAAFAVNTDGTQGLLRAVHRFDPEGRVRFVFASTAQVYDAHPDAGAGDVSLSEGSSLGPRNTYARTKLAAELAVEVIGSAARRPSIIFRPFNHAGPGQRDVFAISNFARQVARIERGQSPAVLETGNLGVSRDFCDVRDIAEAYALAAEGAVPPGVYNLASGRATPLDAVVEILRRLSTRPFDVRVREDRLRDGEAVSLRGEARKMLSACGWQPKVPMEASVLDVLNWWREKRDA